MRAAGLRPCWRITWPLEASFAAGLEEQIISTPLPPREERPLTPAGQRRCEPYLADPIEGNCGLCLRFVGKNWRCMPPPPLLIKGREVDKPFHQGKLRLYETAQVYWSWRESAVPGYQPAEAKFQCHILGAEAALMETCTKNYIKTDFLRCLAKHACSTCSTSASASMHAPLPSGCWTRTTHLLSRGRSSPTWVPDARHAPPESWQSL